VKLLSARYLHTEDRPRVPRDVFEVEFDVGTFVLKRSLDETILGIQAPHEFYQAMDEAMSKEPSLDTQKLRMREIFQALEKERPVARP
jgi:hypothetical protein